MNMTDNTIHKRAMRFEEQRAKDVESVRVQHMIDLLRRRPAASDPLPDKPSPSDGA